MNANRRAAILSAITVGVLAGAYKAVKLDENGEEIFLTHLSPEGEDPLFKSCVKPGHLGDRYSMSEEELTERPTCPRCAAAWDKARA